MNTHISLQLAVWLNENGCKVKTRPEFYYKLTTQGQWHEGDSLSMNPDGSINEQKNPKIEAFLMPAGMVTEADLACGDTIPAYSYYDLLVTCAKEFWGTKNSENVAQLYEAGSCVLDASDNALLNIGILLRLGDFRMAEAYVRENCLFSKKAE